MDCRCDSSDQTFLSAMQSAQFDVADFDHRAHVRLAYVCLVREATDQAIDTLRDLLKHFLAAKGVDPNKYHETLTLAWMLAVRHFMSMRPGSSSAGQFIEANPELLDPHLLLHHYSPERLFSKEARSRFLPADRAPIPIHDVLS